MWLWRDRPEALRGVPVRHRASVASRGGLLAEATRMEADRVGRVGFAYTRKAVVPDVILADLTELLNAVGTVPDAHKVQ